MKMPTVLLSSLSLAVVLGGCQHKSSSHGGSSNDANAKYTEPGDDPAPDVEDEKVKTEVNKAPVKIDPEDPNHGGEVEQPDPAELCLKTDASTCQIEQRILELMNKERAAPTKSGLGGLFSGGGSGGSQPKAELLNGKQLAVIAREWSATQGKRGWIGHDGFPNRRSQAYQQEFQTSANISGENVAMFGGGGDGVEEVAQKFFKMWYNSPGHYRNMVGNFKAAGVGVAQVNGSWWATQIFGAE